MDGIGPAPSTRTRGSCAGAVIAEREQRATLVEECADGRQRKVARADDAALQCDRASRVSCKVSSRVVMQGMGV